ncbi:hypothetical protein DYB37_001143 [Aphanomyces astaci]|uniref:Uncharacterized protein n=1 Tax=Aphanomyces astaci TaxID=112090 RepID=A0A397E786_APHAT|nr:hypothetical protein DYB36_000748 [Aphanomyces astaci]RHY53848.1 hypothetical protein DYB34_003430 [Aphanomyces astaci]RHY77666.1 hypothetical protein DYB38_000914 [Aphanomyces astaci]RHZ05240.1 hypothetical protein DYB26_000212 [Aphanomyces astaci]RHZ10519.1 hypothetical protein DYB31_002484 [Aphanomyces astaci]
MVSLALVKRRICLFTLLSAVFFISCLVPLVLDSLIPVQPATYYCDPTQVLTMRSDLAQLPWGASCISATAFIEVFLPTLVDVKNRPVKPPTSPMLNAFCTVECADAIANLKAYAFLPCDSVLDGKTRSIGSIPPLLCPNGSSVVTVPPAPTSMDRAGFYCGYATLNNAFGTQGTTPLRGSSNTCTQAAARVFFPDVTTDGIPYFPVTLAMVDTLCNQCPDTVTMLRKATMPLCDTVINDKTISFANLSARMCLVKDVTATNQTIANRSTS